MMIFAIFLIIFGAIATGFMLAAIYHRVCNSSTGQKLLGRKKERGTVWFGH
jgi:hypothetical protein